MAFMKSGIVWSAPAPGPAGARLSFSKYSASPAAAAAAGVASLVLSFSPAARCLHSPIAAHAKRNSSDASTSLPLHHPQLLTTTFEASAHGSITRLPTASDLSHLKRPSLRCTFPALVHADYHIVKEPCDAWIDAVAQPPSASASLYLHDCLLPLFVCRLFPTAISRQRLLHVIKAIAWLMVADDDDDHPDVLGSDYTTTARRADLVMAILLTPQQASDSSFDCSFLADSAGPGFANKVANMLKALAKLWHEIRQEMPATLKARFISTMADYFRGLKVQASFREQGNIPDVQSYIEIRRQASFTIPIFVLMEYALGIELDEATFYNSLIQELRNVALDYFSLWNDVVSCPIEIGMGDYFNLPLILYNSSSSPPSFSTYSFQNVVDHVAQMAQDFNNRASFLISTIRDESKNLEPSIVTSIHAYIDGLSLCMSGALAWSHETARYNKASGRIELQQLVQ